MGSQSSNQSNLNQRPPASKNPNKSQQTQLESRAQPLSNHRRTEKLSGLFPAVINLTEPKPLKVGILEDMSQSLKARGETWRRPD